MNVQSVGRAVKTVATKIGGGALAADTARVATSAEKTLLPLTSKELRQVRNIRAKRSNITNKRTIETFGKIDTPIGEYYEGIRSTVIQTLEQEGISPQALKKLKKAKTWGELQAAIYTFADDFRTLEIVPILKKIPKKRSGMPLEIEQMYHKKKGLRDDCVRYIHAMFAQPSRNPEVIKIEKILQEQYGVDIARLGNDLPEAQKILKAVEIAKAKGIPIPKDFIVSNLKSGGEQLMTCRGTESSILIGSNAFQSYMGKYRPPVKLSEQAQSLMQRWWKTTGFANWNSTPNQEHVALHEILHGEHLPFLAFKFKKIPARFKDTINHLSGYAASKPTCVHEVFTELNTKRVLNGLNPQEQELFEFLSKA